MSSLSPTNKKYTTRSPERLEDSVSCRQTDVVLSAVNHSAASSSTITTSPLINHFNNATHLSQYRASSSTDEIPRIGISRRKSEEEKKISGNGARTTANFVKNKSTHSRTDSTIRFGRFASFCPQFHSRLSSSP